MTVSISVPPLPYSPSATKPPLFISTTEIPQPPPPNPTEVLNPALVTQDFDLLRFEAAAFNQLSLIDSSPSTPTDISQTSPVETLSTNLISSPYNNPGHYLDLTTLNPQSLLFAKALTALKPIRPDYATAPYTDALNFDTVLNVLRDLVHNHGGEWKETSFYVVIFRSLLNEHIDQDWLYKLDYESHREACESGGLLKYWFGKSSEERRNLATCKCFSAVWWLAMLIVDCVLMAR